MIGKRLVQVIADKYIPPFFNATAAKKKVGMLITPVHVGRSPAGQSHQYYCSAGSDDDKS
jgi:hypothetical protein